MKVVQAQYRASVFEGRIQPERLLKFGNGLRVPELGVTDHSQANVPFGQVRQAPEHHLKTGGCFVQAIGVPCLLRGLDLLFKADRFRSGQFRLRRGRRGHQHEQQCDACPSHLPVPFRAGSVTVRIWLLLMFSSTWRIPLGQRTSILAARSSSPIPKWTLGSWAAR